MKKNKLWTLFGLLALLLAAAAAWWLQRPDAALPKTGPSDKTAKAAKPAKPASSGGGNAGRDAGRPAPAVEVHRVGTVRLEDSAQAVGSLQSLQSVVLRPEVSGRVVGIAFQDGAAVRKGQLLVQLDDVLQRAELAAANAQLSIARANLARNQALVAQNFVAQRVLEESQANLQVAQAQVALAEARLSRMRILAPFAGTVGLRKVDLGDYVKDGADLVNLEDTSRLRVDFLLPERYQDRLAVGQALQVAIDALPGQAFSARVQAIDPLLDVTGRALSVRALLSPQAGAALRPGMFARVKLVFSVQPAALVVPEQALVPQAGKQFVQRLQGSGEGEARKWLSQRVEVQLGVRHGAEVQVLSGLVAGDTVVVAGQQRLQRDGTAVRVVSLGASGEGADPAARSAASAAAESVGGTAGAVGALGAAGVPGPAPAAR